MVLGGTAPRAPMAPPRKKSAVVSHDSPPSKTLSNIWGINPLLAIKDVPASSASDLAEPPPAGAGSEVELLTPSDLVEIMT